MIPIYPLKLSYILKERIWAGTRLPEQWKKTGDVRHVGESWELSVRPQEMCRVTNGALVGKTLGELIAKEPAILGKPLSTEEFPLLVKLIDAGDRLSVQVHPDDDYAARVEQDRGKTEMWYIVDAAPDAEIVFGLLPDVDRNRFADAVRRGKFEHLLRRQPVKKGECYFIPAGLPHAIGAGILIAEIQQNSDLTYRVYDYDRRDAEGHLRELHVEKALDVIRPYTDEEIARMRFSRSNGIPSSPACLADCERFTVCGRQILGTERITCGGHARHLLCMEGEGELLSEGVSYSIAKGDSYLLPAALTEVTLRGSCLLLETLLSDEMLSLSASR